ncbi:hypothetical protein HDV62DRAFT_292400 [Trichoderma sp. SZMC 28011]
MTVHEYYWYMRKYQYSARYFHIYTRELSLQRHLARESHPALDATESISCMREMGARRTFRLSGHCLQEGRQAFSFEAMYTIKRASVAGRLNAVLTPGTLFNGLNQSSSCASFLWFCRGLVESGIMPRFAVRCPRLPFLSNIGAFSKWQCYSVPCGSCLQMMLLGLGGFKPRWEVNMHTHVYAPPSMLLKRLVVGVPNSKLPDISMYDTRCSTAGQASEASRMNWFLLAGP